VAVEALCHPQRRLVVLAGIGLTWEILAVGLALKALWLWRQALTLLLWAVEVRQTGKVRHLLLAPL
jgi:hypothetical protein